MTFLYAYYFEYQTILTAPNINKFLTILPPSSQSPHLSALFTLTPHIIPSNALPSKAPHFCSFFGKNSNFSQNSPKSHPTSHQISPSHIIQNKKSPKNKGFLPPLNIYNPKPFERNLLNHVLIY